MRQARPSVPHLARIAPLCAAADRSLATFPEPRANETGTLASMSTRKSMNFAPSSLSSARAGGFFFSFFGLLPPLPPLCLAPSGQSSLSLRWSSSRALSLVVWEEKTVYSVGIQGSHRGHTLTLGVGLEGIT